jgi:hypothetical protein
LKIMIVMAAEIAANSIMVRYLPEK